MKKNILAIVVTHNRLNYLKRLIDSLQNQARKIDDILIVNNSSTDGTLEYLKLNNLKYITQENNGSASGWNTGIKYALNHHYDYVWMMDDDGFPDLNSLKILLENINLNHSSLSSVVLKENKKNELVFPMPKLNKLSNPIIFPLFRKYKKINDLNKKHSVFYNYAHFFNGSLISIDCIKKIGNVYKDYIIYGDEVDYFYRLRSVGLVQTCLLSYHFHPDVSKRIISHRSAYYYLRNSIIINYKYIDKPNIRSILNIFILFYRLFNRNGIINSLTFLFNYKKNMFLLALIDAFQKRLGKIE